MPQSNEFVDGLAGTVDRTVDKLGMVSYKALAAGTQPISRLAQQLDLDSKRLPKVCSGLLSM